MDACDRFDLSAPASPASMIGGLLGPREAPGTAAKLAATGLIVGLFGMVAGVGTWSSFNEKTQNPSNSFSAGTVSLTDDDSGAALFSALTNVKPGDVFSRCIVVTYTGDLPSSVRLSGTTGGGGLDRYLTLQVTRGTKASAFSSCADFTADTPTYLPGEAQGVVYRGTLENFPDSYGAGIVDPVASAPESWTADEKHAYRFTVTAGSDSAAQSKTATQRFVWEAQNE